MVSLTLINVDILCFSSSCIEVPGTGTDNG